MRIAVLGAGAWGTALALAACRSGQHQVLLWARDASQAQGIAATRENSRYLPGIGLPQDLAVAHGEIATHTANVDLVVVATPVAGLRAMLLALRSIRTPVA